MSHKFEKFQSSGKRKGLRATSLLSPGDLLYVAEPFAYTPLRPGTVCEFCLCIAENLLQCSRCKFAKYCNARCQREAWLDHKRECKYLKGDWPIMVRLTGKTIVKLLRRSPCPSEELCPVSKLLPHIKDLNEHVNEELALVERAVRTYLKEDIQLPADFNINEYCAKVIGHSFTIYGGWMMGVAIGLYPSMSLLKHSCDPNCAVIFEGQRIHLRAMRVIQVGEELTVSYIDTAMPTEDRQDQLRQKYGFRCSCLRCQTREQDEDMLAGDKKASEETKDFISVNKELKDQQKWDQLLSLCETRLKKNADLLPDRNIYQLRTVDYAMEACTGLNKVTEALQYCRRSLEPFRLYHPGLNPSWAVRMSIFGTLHLLQGKLPEAEKIFKEALEIMTVSHGKDHSLTQNLIKGMNRWKM